MKQYTLYSGLYRFFNGVVLLLLNWHIASADGGGYGALAVSTTLSFVPAVFVPLLIRFCPIAGGARMTAAGLAGVSLTLLLIAAGYSDVHLVIALNFVLWVFFFFLESSWEVWFNEEASGLDGVVLRQQSSLTMTVNQVALMVGPLFAPLLTQVMRAEWVLAACAALFAAVAILSLGSHRAEAAADPAEQETGPTGTGSPRTLYLLAFVLVWPVLGTFNFMLPLQVLANDGSMFTVGVLDMLLGIGMAVAGALLHRFTKSRDVRWLLAGAAVAVIAAVVLWSLAPTFGTPQMAAVFALGCAFGAVRVLLRAEAASHFSPRQVGALVANANACSLILLAAVLAGGQYFSSEIWLAPFALTLLLVTALHAIRKVQNDRLVPTEVSE
ncbi:MULTISPECIES: hypothetical protein [unclassified Streptomyces]|uniref:hypothetical protein n=1 Tax=unclassified Streptomyces TaxID=2593676 RepID=UPI00344C1D89